MFKSHDAEALSVHIWSMIKTIALAHALPDWGAHVASSLPLEDHWHEVYSLA